LIALGRNDAAQTQIESLVTVDPMFVPPAGEISPRVTATFTDARRRLLPQLARKTFNEARQLFQSGDRTRAREQFKLTMQMLDDSLIDEGADLADLRLVASGFLDLVETEKPAATAAAPVAAAPIAPPPPMAAGSAAVARAVAGTATLPLTVEQTLPPWRPDGIAARRAYVGAVQVAIDAEGRVTGARMSKPVHASYDPLVLAAARKWLYKPATLNGVPVASEKTVEIELRPDR
jgi:TonB family protein